jgi:hypothetical protein
MRHCFYFQWIIDSNLFRDLSKRPKNLSHSCFSWCSLVEENYTWIVMLKNYACNETVTSPCKKIRSHCKFLLRTEVKQNQKRVQEMDLEQLLEHLACIAVWNSLLADILFQSTTAMMKLRCAQPFRSVWPVLIAWVALYLALQERVLLGNITVTFL